MSRRRNAAIFAIFTYGQSVVGMLLGLLVTRIVLGQLGRDLYGLWIASGALLSYAGLADLGVLGVLPWMIAEADGKKDAARVRALLSNAIAFAVGGGIAFAIIGAGMWHLYPAVLHLSQHDRATLAGPVFVVVVASALTLPLRVFSALLTGLQDATWVGAIAIGQTLATSLLTLGLTLAGHGLYGLAIGTSLPPLLTAAISFGRALRIGSSLFAGWPRPSLSLLRLIMTDGVGTWLGSLGFQLVAGTDPVVLTYLGLRDVVPSFAVSTRLALTLMQFGWILPDAALIGLAHLAAEAPREKVREVVLALLRLHTIISGAMAIAVLAANGGFIRIWVGSDFFLGMRFNLITAANLMLLTTIHGLGTVASVLGKRLEIGVALIANGALHIALALAFGSRLGVYGVVAATFISGTITCLPIALRLIEPASGIAMRDVLTNVYLPYVVRFFPLALLALVVGRFGATIRLPLLVLSCSMLGIAYLWWMKPMYTSLPLGPKVTRWLQLLRLVG